MGGTSRATKKRVKDRRHTPIENSLQENILLTTSTRHTFGQTTRGNDTDCNLVFRCGSYCHRLYCNIHKNWSIKNGETKNSAILQKAPVIYVFKKPPQIDVVLLCGIYGCTQ